MPGGIRGRPRNKQRLERGVLLARIAAPLATI